MPSGGTVPAEVLRRLIQERGLSYRDVAIRLDWRDNRDHIDTQRLERRLGVKPYLSRVREDGRRQYLTKRVTTRVALEVANALQLDPHEVGL